MTNTQTDATTLRQPLRLWPGVVIVALQWLGRFVVPIVVPEAMVYGVLGGLVGGLAIVVWWVFFSRAPWSERAGAILLMVVVMALTPSILHESIATGNMGMMFPLYAIPVLSLAFVAWAAASRNLPDRTRFAALVATVVAACGVWALVSDRRQYHRPRPRFRLAVVADCRGAAPGSRPATSRWRAQRWRPRQRRQETAWPSFRGQGRDSIIRDVRIDADWSASPPAEVWRRKVGPGWSSFAVRGDLFYTQEQRGDDEVVSCYHATTGEPVWRHRDPARFWESVGGAGPRGTPTLAGDRVYTFGGTGILNALDADDGTVVWSRNAATDTEAKLPDWGFSSSPLVVDDMVIVAASGALVAYDLATGEPRWFGPKGGTSYSSPQLLTIGGVPQILQLNGAGLNGVTPADGTLLWQHEWSGYPIVQPALTADGDVLISVSDSSGTRRIAVANGPGGWTAEERWTSRGLKSYFNDFVVHEGHAYGFDGSILACIDLEDGERKWKGGRYGGGQLVLLADQDLLLVLSEKGELALVGATPEGFTERGRVPAIEGKTWNHPVLAGDLLLVRNSEEMAAFRLSS